MTCCHLQQLATQMDAASLPEEHLYVALPGCTNCQQSLDDDDV